MKLEVADIGEKMPEENNLDQVGKLPADVVAKKRVQLGMISPDDNRYTKESEKLGPYLSAEAHLSACAYMQMVFLETRMEFGQAEERHLDDLDAALQKIDPLNMQILEDEVTRHDIIATLEEIGRYVSPETKALLHPGTTSYDVVDTARAYLFKKAWNEVVRPKVIEVIGKLCDLGELYAGLKDGAQPLIQVGRTHLQDTSPVVFGNVLAGYARRLAERVQKADSDFDDLRGKVSGIVGTGAGIEMVVGKGNSRDFEMAVLGKLGLKPDLAATQIAHKERMADVGHQITVLDYILADFANDIRLLYSSAIREVASSDSSRTLGGSSTDAGKDNPVKWENIVGKRTVIASGMIVLYEAIISPLQRTLDNSVQGRYQPQQMMTEMHESFCRASKALDKLAVYPDKIAENLAPVRKVPTEAMVTITRGQGFVHPKHGDPHNMVKKFAQQAKQDKVRLLDIALKDDSFSRMFEGLDKEKRRILEGELELYLGSSIEDAKDSIAFAKCVK